MLCSSQGLTTGARVKRRAADSSAGPRPATAALSCAASRLAAAEPAFGGGARRTSDGDPSTHVFHFPAVGSAAARSSESPQPASAPRVIAAARAATIAMEDGLFTKVASY